MPDASKKDFQQLEDFNKGAGGDDEYTKEYFENLLGNKHGVADGEAPRRKNSDKDVPKGPPRKLTPEEIQMLNQRWENNDLTTTLWSLIAADEYDKLKSVFAANPHVPHVRSEDGRGPMWWAHEHGNTRLIKLLKKHEVSETLQDANGMTPLMISKVGK